MLHAVLRKLTATMIKGGRPVGMDSMNCPIPRGAKKPPTMVQVVKRCLEHRHPTDAVP